MRDFNVLFDNVELRSLLVDHMRDVAEQLVQLTNALLDVPDLRLTLDDEVLLEVHLFLVRESQLFLLLLLAKVTSPLFAG